jgi:RsiW-degrading membrane proteinase PrsW (M82 family)
MNSVWILTLLIGASALPALAAALWFRLSRFPIQPVWFLAFLMGGAVSIFPGLLLRGLFPFDSNTNAFLVIFVQTALSEELGRLILLIPLILIWFRLTPQDTAKKSPLSIAAGAGCLMGLGFAIMETVIYTLNSGDMFYTLMIRFLAALLHASCACRVAMAVRRFPEEPLHAAFNFILAVALHGMYDLMIRSNMPIALPILLVTAMAVRTIQIVSAKPPEADEEKSA